MTQGDSNVVICINDPVLGQSPFGMVMMVEGPKSMALNELGESFLFLIPKSVLTGPQTYRPEEMLG